MSALYVVCDRLPDPNGGGEFIDLENEAGAGVRRDWVTWGNYVALEVTPELTETEVNRMAQKLYEAGSANGSMNFPSMTAKADVVQALREALEHVGVKVVGS